MRGRCRQRGCSARRRWCTSAHDIDKEDKFVIDREDEIVRATLVCADGAVLRT